MAMSIAAERSSGKTIIGYNYTKNPALPQARRLIEDGVIGRVAGFFCRYDVERETDKQRPCHGGCPAICREQVAMGMY